MAVALPELSMPGTEMVRLLRICEYGLGAYFEPVFRLLGLTEHHFHVLCLLMAEDSGAASPSELSEMVGTSRANMTRLLEQLAKAGYVARETHPLDGRRQIIKITVKGRAKALDTAPRLRGPIEDAFSDLSDDEFRVLVRLLRKLILSLDKQPLRGRVAA
ncbi:MarR family winged helix-turn-helix transcriptional regulator [Polycyclovorans algicola]|uniref:MarR family winged helix-turn-helix transcriptional regulator n=1 Tax=Polycyclovorans algicola TaxID=616992 RepID=UPI0004A775AA|nr:MarR family transcriptional regulator [Polycyclovorans algicola]